MLCIYSIVGLSNIWATVRPSPLKDSSFGCGARQDRTETHNSQNSYNQNKPKKKSSLMKKAELISL